MRLTHTDPAASSHTVWFRNLVHEKPWRVHACLLADEEAGLVQFVLLGPERTCSPEFGIGFDAPLPPAEELSYGHATGRLLGYVNITRRGEEPQFAPEDVVVWEAQREAAQAAFRQRDFRTFVGLALAAHEQKRLDGLAD